MTRQNIEQAIAILEQQRPSLGQNVVDTSLAALHNQLDNIEQLNIPPSALRGERKLVTVMFADISGFTAMSEQLDPEEVRGLINACFERLGQVIDRYGGYIDKFIGDEIMALFGAPFVHENDPERALRAALEMMKTLEAFSDEYAHQLPKPLALHFGINTGLVIAGGIGTSRRQDYSVVGDTVNLAARLEDLSEAGEILVGENTYRFSTPLFEFEPLAPVQVKGKSQPVRVYRLLKAKAVPAGQIRGIDGLHSSLVGRSSEMTQLQDILTKLYSGRGRIVSVIGDAGLGKSRLVAELQAKCEQERNVVWWARGRAISHADTTSYLVARDTLRQVLNIGPSTSSSEAVEMLFNVVEKLLPHQLQEVYPYLGTLLEIPLDPEAQDRIKYLSGDMLHQRLLEATRNFITAKSQRVPLVLVWEDLHWADASSLELLEALVPLSHDHKLLFLLIFRPPLKGSKIWHFQQKLQQRHADDCLTEITLPPLTDAESRELLTNLLGAEALPLSVSRMIVAKAEGNPLYLEEVIRSLIESQAITRSHDRWVAQGELGQITLPDTLQSIIMARIDRLDPQAKRVLQIAAAIGRNFSIDVLTQVLKGEPEPSQGRS